MSVAFARSSEGIDFGGDSDQPSGLIFLIAAPAGGDVDDSHDPEHALAGDHPPAGADRVAAPLDSFARAGGHERPRFQVALAP